MILYMTAYTCFYPVPAANTATALGNPRGKKLFVLLRKLLSKWC